MTTEQERVAKNHTAMLQIINGLQAELDGATKRGFFGQVGISVEVEDGKIVRWQLSPTRKYKARQ